MYKPQISKLDEPKRAYIDENKGPNIKARETY